MRFRIGHQRRLKEGEMWDEVPGPLSTPCWIWRGKPVKADGRGNGGYGVLVRDGWHWMAHRWTYKRFRGEPPAELDHLCRNRLCVNPWHLEPVDHRTNVLRGEGPTAKNAAKTHCKHGHALSGDNLYIRPNGHRDCKLCIRKRSREAKRRARAAEKAQRARERE